MTGLPETKMRSTSRSVRLSQLFPQSLGFQTNAGVARLCVLFEDLRIEVAGLILPANRIDDPHGLVPRLDKAGSGYRRTYFLRRSILTCVEFGDAVHELNTVPDFTRLVSTFPDASKRSLDAAVKYFSVEKHFWKKVRNDVGGHFGHQAATYAAKEFLPDAGGVIEFRQSGGKVGFILKFAGEIAGTALVRRLPNGTPKEKIDNLIEKVRGAYCHAGNAAVCIAANHIWPRAE